MKHCQAGWAGRVGWGGRLVGAAGWGAGQFLKAETPPQVAVAERGERGWEPDEGEESEPVLPAAAANTEAWNDDKYLK